MTDEDIASYLSQETGYDLDAAYESGLDPTDVITYLADVEDDPTAATTRGLLRGLAQGSGMVTGGMLGAPLACRYSWRSFDRSNFCRRFKFNIFK